MKLAISTVACPHWTLPRVVRFAEQLDVSGLELRTFGDNSAHFTPDPCLTSFPKIRAMLADAGILPACLATSIRYDAAVWPPVIGRVAGDHELSIRATKRMVEVAAQIECPFVRVFAFELPERESRRAGLRRIADRLSLAAATARNTGVRLLLENGGSFPTAEDVAEIISRVGSPLIAASYSPAVAQAVGEDPVAGVRTLKGMLETVKLKDFDGTTPVPIGRGEMRCRETVEELVRQDYRGWTVIEWDRLWLSNLAPAEEALPGAVDQVARWWHAPAVVAEPSAA